MKYQILEHKADIKIKIFGKNLKELFLNSLSAIKEILNPKIKSPKEKIERKIKIKSENLSFLFMDFLCEINYLSEIHKEIYEKIKFKKLSEKEMEAILEGKRVEGFSLQIKGVTWHNFEISQKKNKTWQAKVLFDI